MRKLALAASSITILALAACGDNASGPPDAMVPADAMRTADATGDAAPGPVTNLSAVAGAPRTVTLTWTNPGDADLAGVLVVAGQDVAIDFAPVDGVTYNVGDPVGTASQTVIFAAAGTTTDLTTAVPGLPYNFAAWAYDAAGQYSPIALTTGRNDAIGPQNATLSVDLTTEVVTVTNPANLAITATAVYNDAADTLDIDVTVQNNTARLLFNLKGLSTAINSGVQAGNLFPIVGGQPSTYFGPESLDVGAQVTRTIALTGVDGVADPVTVDLSFVDHFMLYGANYGGSFVATDSSGSTEGAGFDFPSSAAAQVRQMVTTNNGKFIYGVGKDEPGVAIIDTTTLAVVAGADLSTAGLGSAGGIAINADNSSIYVGYNDLAHYHGSDGGFNGPGSAAPNVHVIHFDSALVEAARLTLATADADGHTAKSVYISPDGTTLGVLVSSRSAQTSALWLIDLTTFTIIDTDAVTAGNQPVTLSAGAGFAEHGAWAEDGGAFYVGFNNHRTGGAAVAVDVVTMATYAVTQLTPATAGNAAGAMTVRNGKLYYPSRNDQAVAGGALTIFTLAGGTQVDGDLNGNESPTGVMFAPDRVRYFVTDFENVMTFTAADDVRVDTDGDAGNGVTDVTALEQFRAHAFVTSPF